MRRILGVAAIPVLAGLICGAVALTRSPSALRAWLGGGRPARQVAPPDRGPEFPGAPTTPIEALRLLRARDFATLTRVIEARQQRQERDIRDEQRMAAVLVAFDTADPAMTPLMNEWLTAAPRSFAPRLARAIHRLALAGHARGTKWASETTETQFAGMESDLQGAVEDAEAVLAVNPRSPDAHRMLIRAAMFHGDQAGCTAAATKVLGMYPGSMRVRTALALCYLPRWGGSYQLIERLAQDSDRYLRDNPALAALHGFVEWDLGTLAPFGSDSQMQHYDAAVAAGEESMFYRSRASAWLRKGNPEKALADTARALALSPEDSRTLIIRASALAALARHQEAVAAIRLAEELDPVDDALADFRHDHLARAAKEGYDLSKSGSQPGAVAILSDAIELTGGNAEAYYWRGRAYLKMNDLDRGLADFERAIRCDVGHFESYRNVDYVLARRGDWNGVISHWTQYLAAVPADGRGYMERGGAHYHNGDRSAALGDLRKACEMGTQEACALAPGLK